MTPYRPCPPAMPLSPSQRVQVAAVTFGLSVLALLVAMCACQSNPPALTPAAAQAAAEQAEVAAYAAEEQECVAKAADRPTADVCILLVQAHWCGDGGALAARGDCPGQVAGNADRLNAMMVHAQSLVNAAVADGGGGG